LLTGCPQVVHDRRKIDQLIPLRDAFAVQMTEAFASAVTVTVPILALAAGAEARAVRDRLRRPDDDWEREFEAHQASHEFDPARPPSELLGLVWLGDGGGAGDSGLATFSVVTIALALAALIMAPAIYLFVPVLLPLDLVPHGLKKALAPRIAGKEGRGFVKVLLSELESALERAVEKVEDAKETAPGTPGDGEPPTPA
jgi:hypothetical protein